MTPTLWIDVEDLFEYARGHQRPSGIQRVAFEISRTLHARHGDAGRVRFLRHDPAHGGFREVAWPRVAAMFSLLTEPESGLLRDRAVARLPPGGIKPHSGPRQFARQLVHRLPASLRFHVTNVLLTQENAFRAWMGLWDALARGIVRTPHRLRRRFHARRVMAAPAPVPAATDGWEADGSRTTAPAADKPAADRPTADRPTADGSMAAGPAARRAVSLTPGDTLLVLGAPWSHPNYPALIRRQPPGFRFALLVHDIVPLRRPEWCDQGTIRLFHAFFDGILPLCDHIFAVSKATAADVTDYARSRGVPVARPVMPIPIGTGFGAAPPSVLVPRTARLPPAGGYALFVSTIEARKNHLLLFRVWRRLLEELAPERVPLLVFAGRRGWLVDDLMRQIVNTDYLNGHLTILDKPADDEIAALYQGCLFTLYPSFHEGWGLPVTESLAFGKPCLIANRTSLPEAGGPLVRGFDPDDLNDAHAKIRAIILDREDLARWEDQIRREFRPVPWAASIDVLLAALAPEAAPVCPEPAVPGGR